MTYKFAVIDLETLGTKPGAPILSIGAAAFSLERHEMHIFYKKLHLLGQDMSKVDPATLLWWMEQSQAARDYAFQETEEAETIWTAVSQFTIWIERLKREAGEEPTVWGNSSSFDNELLRALYEQCGMDAPWSFRADRDFRTVKALYKDKVPEPEFVGVRHFADDDAAHEAKWLRSILLYINSTKA